MADSDSSSLSSAPSSDDEEMELKMTKPTGLNRYFKPAPKPDPTPEPPKRAPSPPHEYTLADNEAIAFLVMFRSRFSDAFPRSLPHFGPQDIERGVGGPVPDEHADRLLCALLGLVLNRKKDVESVISPCPTYGLHSSMRCSKNALANRTLSGVVTTDGHSKMQSPATTISG